MIYTYNSQYTLRMSGSFRNKLAGTIQSKYIKEIARLFLNSFEPRKKS